MACLLRKTRVFLDSPQLFRIPFDLTACNLSLPVSLVCHDPTDTSVVRVHPNKNDSMGTFPGLNSEEFYKYGTLVSGLPQHDLYWFTIDYCTMNLEKSSVEKRIPYVLLSAILFLCCALLFAAGCTAPQQAGVKTNDTVLVFYTVSFPDGTEFQSNVNGSPLEFTVGSGDVIAGFDEAVIGMTPGMTKTVTIGPEKGYGPHNASLVYVLDIEEARAMNKELQEKGNLQVINYPSIGPVVLWQGEGGQTGYLRFMNTTLETTTVDMNHPLAGKDLIFEITLVDIVEKTS